MNYLTIDVGTTRCKCQLFSSDGKILEYIGEDYEFKRVGKEIFVDADAIWQNVKSMIKKVALNHEISSFCVSTFGESFVVMDKDDNIIYYPMMYTDPKGIEEAAFINRTVGEENCFLTTGVVAHSMYSISKVLWLKNNQPEIYKKADKVLLIGDFVAYMLTGKRIIDYALAARTGAFDVKNKVFAKEFLDKIGIPVSLFSTPMQAGSVVGRIKEELIEELGVKGDATFVLGSHDQVCAALGAGVLKEGESVDGMGTVECITTVFKDKPENIAMGKQGYPCIPFAVDGLYCTYILNYTCGAAVNWVRKNLMHDYKGEEKDFYAYMEKNFSDTPTGLLTMPYLGGGATPYQDITAKGAVIGIGTQTTDAEFYQSFVEGTVMEMKLNTEIVKDYGITVKSLIANGGCSNSDKWMQLKADVQGVSVKTLRSSEGGLCGCAMMSAVALGGAKDYAEAKDIFVRYVKEFTPNEERGATYDGQYKKYKKLYHLIKEIN
ncbi:MAG: hypothetical protein IKA11_03610 [Clostridia bacterium]|nr:hypothetical protein [Clostridia bacterium]